MHEEAVSGPLGALGRLYPPAPRRSWPLPEALGVVALVAVVLAAGTGLSLLRQQGLPATNTLWAEDGAVFLTQAGSAGPLAALHLPVGGYLNLYPRLLAALVVEVTRPGQSAAAVAVLAAASTTALALVVYLASAGHLRSRWLRSALALAVALPAVGNADLANDFNNLHWYFVIAVFWTLVWRPVRLPARGLAFAVCFLGAASDGTALLLAPVALGRLVSLRAERRATGSAEGRVDCIDKGERGGAEQVALRKALRNWREQAPVAGYALGAALQVLTILTSLGTGPPGRPDSPLNVLASYGLRVGVGAFVGPGLTQQAWLALGWAAVALGLLAVVGLAVLGLRRGGCRRRLLVATCLVYQAAFFLVPLVVRGGGRFYPSHPNLASGLRYAAVPTWFLLSALALSVEDTVAGWRRRAGPLSLARAGPVLVAATLVLVGVATATNFAASGNGRQLGPAWGSQLRQAAVRCAARRPASVTVPIPPGGPWAARVPCRHGVLTWR